METLFEYLVKRKFSDQLAMREALGTPEATLDGRYPDVNEETVQQIKSYITEFRQLAPDTVEALHETEKIKTANERKLREEEEERKLFFRQPAADADYSHWCRLRTGRSMKRLLFTFGKDPHRYRGNA